jgi:hypothetical protein
VLVAGTPFSGATEGAFRSGVALAGTSDLMIRLSVSIIVDSSR